MFNQSIKKLNFNSKLMYLPIIIILKMIVVNGIGNDDQNEIFLVTHNTNNCKSLNILISL